MPTHPSRVAPPVGRHQLNARKAAPLTYMLLVSLTLTPPHVSSASTSQVIIPAGLLVDNNFMITASGEAIWAPNGKRPGT